MGKAKVLFLVFIFFTTAAYSASDSTGIGVSIGSGVPYLGQGGVHYRLSEQFTFYGGYNILSLSIGSARAKLTMPEALIQFHPFSSAFYIGAGLGQEDLLVTATESSMGQEVRAEVSAMTGIAKIGWMWDVQDGGFWFGIDLAYIVPMSPKTTITAPGIPITDPDYQDVKDAANRFGETSYINFTFARLGYIF